MKMARGRKFGVWQPWREKKGGGGGGKGEYTQGAWQALDRGRQKESTLVVPTLFE
jgi:hypothetical protein